ncbi:unnamed protein product [Tetraodon nigroviridis]|uniref:(spotted green pufferfish) hypothetical protein n=1 Tax=Tetraodon nigroviridis TaxID=99883 RepID=Q4T9B8_TETNG|nr:unnamed protein product [Tetraodon nigroviridis]
MEKQTKKAKTGSQHLRTGLLLREGADEPTGQAGRGERRACNRLSAAR